MGKTMEFMNSLIPGMFKPSTPDLPKDQILDTADQAGQDAAEAERRRRNQTETNRSGSASSALSAAIGRTTLGGS